MTVAIFYIQHITSFIRPNVHDKSIGTGQIFHMQCISAGSDRNNAVPFMQSISAKYDCTVSSCQIGYPALPGYIPYRSVRQSHIYCTIGSYIAAEWILKSFTIMRYIPFLIYRILVIICPA